MLSRRPNGGLGVLGINCFDKSVVFLGRLMLIFCSLFLFGTTLDTQQASADSSFSNYIAVDTIMLSEGRENTIVVVTVRVPTRLRSIKCAVIDGIRYRGVGSIVNASPPAEEVYVTIPGIGYSSSVRAECSSAE